jgi:prepilin-type N-terminal cleavage/methylation domain-containing protein
MLSKIRQRKAEGFTIIEVLIVLAIAGLILLVVFLAVPALQRNARNTQRSNDIASVLGAMNEFVNNNNGTLPTGAAVAADGTLTISGAAGSNSVTTKLGYYKSGVSLSAAAPGAVGVNSTTTNTVVLYTAADCNSSGTQAIDGQTRGFAATYTLEAAAKECKAS